MQCTRGGTRSYTLGAAQSSRTLVPATSVCSVPLKLGRSKPTHHKQASLSQYKHTVSSWAKAPVMVSEQRQLAESSSVRNIWFCIRPSNCALFLTAEAPSIVCFSVSPETEVKPSGEAAAGLSEAWALIAENLATFLLGFQASVPFQLLDTRSVSEKIRHALHLDTHRNRVELFLRESPIPPSSVTAFLPGQSFVIFPPTSHSYYKDQSQLQGSDPDTTKVPGDTQVSIAKGGLFASAQQVPGTRCAGCC